MVIEYLVGKNDRPEKRLVIRESKREICVTNQKQAFAETVLYLSNKPGVARLMNFRGRKHIEMKLRASS